ncbi:fimbrial assembly protein [Roseateles sp. BYS180W]|uniref:Fimbrial assembly protein n=1 Tax=Roseateles rivi TaxID=3299028 RepID=A0ABW7FRI2_9BURK
MSLIEVLTAVLLISLSLLGLVALYARATQYSVESEDSLRAASLASELGARMWACNTVELSDAQLQAWQARVADAPAAGLPQGTGTVTPGSDRQSARVTISWRPPSATAAAANSRYETDIVLAQRPGAGAATACTLP